GFGLPVIGTSVSAVPETVPPEAGILVPPENAGALAAALRRVLSDEPARRAYAEGARRAAARLPTWNEAADVFVLPSRFEGYGMAFAEAIGFGLPVIGTAVSAVPETVPPEAGILVPPENAGALAAALRRLLSDEPARRAYAEGARRAAARLPTWNEAADVFIQVIKGVA
ncbi:MAG TPA: glycosyltransferase, partial [Xanthobacteraceae bacterium]